jgi:hypothetical protein
MSKNPETKALDKEKAGEIGSPAIGLDKREGTIRG